MMSALERFVTSRFTISIVILVLLGLLIWYFGPELKIDDWVPFASPLSRIATILGLAATFLLFEILRRWRLRRINQYILSQMGERQADDSLKEREIGQVRESFSQFMSLFQRRAGLHGSYKRQFRSLSWYLILGEQQAGRTSVLNASGMEFPLEDQVEADYGRAPDVLGFCEWRVTDNAVYVDVPGELIFQKSQIDVAEWRDLCDCLASVRRVRPLNGVVLTVPAPTLLSEEQSNTQANMMRARLQELMARFGEHLPVYLLVTKSDLITGFVDFFVHLETDERNRPLGVQVPLPESRSRSGKWLHAKDKFTAKSTLLTAFRSRFDQFTAQLSDQTFAQLAEERETKTRRRIFSFPQQMLALSLPIERFLQQVFSSSRFRYEAMFRGVYFCSTAQSDNCIDSLMDAHKKVYGFKTPDKVNQRRLGGEVAYFCRGFMRDVLLSESALRLMSPVLQRSQLRRTVVICTSIFALSSVLIYSWLIVLGTSNEQHIAFAKALSEHEKLYFTLPDKPELKDATLSVAPLVAVTDIDNDNRPIKKLIYKIGALTLQPSLELSKRMNTLYSAADNALVRPALVRDLGNELSLLNNANETSFSRLKATLALYLGLSIPDRHQSKPLAEWAKGHIQRNIPAEPQKQEAAIEAIYSSLEKLNKPIELDTTVVNNAQRRLFKAPLAARVYKAAKEKATDLPILNIRDLLGGESAVFVSNDTADSSSSITGYYTEIGYYENFVPEIPKHILEERDSEWMAGNWTTKINNADVLAETSALFAKDFTDEWLTALDNLAFRKINDVTEARELYDLLLSTERPLNKLVAIVYDHTKLPAVRGTEPRTPRAESKESKNSIIGASEKVLESVNKSVKKIDINWPGHIIRDVFEPYHALHEERTGEVSGLKDVHARLSDIHNILIGIQDEDKPGRSSFEVVARWMDSPLESEIMALRQVATSLPPALRQMLFALTDQTNSVLIHEARQHIEEIWDLAVLEECTRGIKARYPVSKHAQIAIAPDDFESFFMPKGTIDTFFDFYAAPYLNDGGNRSSNRHSSIGFSKPALDAFHNAEAIRKAFALDRAKLRDAAFTIEPEFLDSQATSVMIETDSRSFSYRHEPPRRFRMRIFDEFVSINIVDKGDQVHTVRVTGPWSWFRVFDRFELQPTATPDHFVFRVEIDGLFADFRITADSTINPFTNSAIREFECEENLL